MKRVVLLSGGIALTLSMTACERATAPADAPATTEASPADTDAVKQMETDFLAAIEAKDAAKLRGYYAADAVMVLPGQAPLKGISAISADYDQFAKDPAGKFDATNESTVVGADMAYSQGTYTVAYTNRETKAVDNSQGYYLVVYKKQPDGSWKIVQDISSPTPAAG